MSTSLFDLTDKVALGTGGNGVKGFSIAKGLGQSGAKIIVGHINYTEIATNQMKLQKNLLI